MPEHLIEIVKVTDSDRKRWPYMDEETVKCFKYIAGQPTERLLACITFDSDGAVSWTNPEIIHLNNELLASINWAIGSIAEELYDRGAIDETKLDRIMD